MTGPHRAPSSRRGMCSCARSRRCGQPLRPSWTPQLPPRRSSRASRGTCCWRWRSARSWESDWHCYGMRSTVASRPRRGGEGGRYAAARPPSFPSAQGLRRRPPRRSRERRRRDISCAPGQRGILSREGSTLARIMVAGAQRDEGSTSVAINLAVALAQAGRRITLVDLDLRRSGLTRMPGLEAALASQTPRGTRSPSTMRSPPWRWGRIRRHAGPGRWNNHSAIPASS